MDTYITSDNHFNHANIIKYCDRPYRSVKQMNEDMIKKWNKRISGIDIVYHLGDFAFARNDIHRLRNFRNQLNGTIFILPGNHDGVGMLKNSRFIVKPSTFKIKNLILSHKPLERVPDGFVNVHGHIHEKETYGRRINASVDVTNFRPRHLNYYVKKANKILKLY